MGKRVLWQAFLLVILAVSLLGCGKENDREYVVKINQEIVPKGEFMLYLNEAEQEFEALGGTDIWETDFEGQTASEVAKDRALNSIKMVKVASQNAARFSVSLSAEEKAKAEEDANKLYDSIPEDVKASGDILLADAVKTAEDKMRYNKVYEAITKDFVVSAADFQVFYDKNQETSRKALRLYSLTSILVEDEKTAREVQARALSGEDFEALAQEYEIDAKAKESGGQMEAYQGMLERQFDTEFHLSVGEISDVLKAPEGYYIFRVDALAEPTEAQVDEYCRSLYIDEMKKQLFLQEYDKWANDAAVEKNEAVWSTITAGIKEQGGGV